MEGLTLADLNDFADRLDRSAVERNTALRRELDLLREEQRRMEKGVYHRVDEIKRRLDRQDTRLEDLEHAPVVIDEPVTEASSPFALPALSKRQKVGTVVLVLMLFLSAFDAVREGLTLARDVFKTLHP